MRFPKSLTACDWAFSWASCPSCTSAIPPLAASSTNFSSVELSLTLLPLAFWVFTAPVEPTGPLFWLLSPPGVLELEPGTPVALSDGVGDLFSARDRLAGSASPAAMRIAANDLLNRVIISCLSFCLPQKSRKHTAARTQLHERAAGGH